MFSLHFLLVLQEASILDGNSSSRITRKRKMLIGLPIINANPHDQQHRSAASVVADASASKNKNQHGLHLTGAVVADNRFCSTRTNEPTSKRTRVQESAQQECEFAPTFEFANGTTTDTRYSGHQLDTATMIKRPRPPEYGKDKEEESDLARNDDDLMLDTRFVDEGLWLDDDDL